MKMNMLKFVGSEIAGGLLRKTVDSCSEWAERYRVMDQPIPGPWRFKYHPWLRDMHDCWEELIVGMKCAQIGFTECALNKAMYKIDINHTSVLYVLPAAKPDASDFSTARFDPALENSEHLKNLFSDVKNIGHKRAGNANFYLRGSRSRSQLKSIPTGFNILDEIDEFVQENIPMIFERMSGQLEKCTFMLSTPTIENTGIHAHYEVTDQKHYYFKCPHCSRWTELVFPSCLVSTAEKITDPKIYDSYIVCKDCKHKLCHETKHEWLALDNAKWVPSFSDRRAAGFHVNQLYSSTVKPYELAISYIKAQTNAADEQEFWNSKMGMPHTVEGAKVTDKQLDNCTGDYTQASTVQDNALITMGIDVGKWLHYEIAQWYLNKTDYQNDINLIARSKVLKVGKVRSFDELVQIIADMRVQYAVIDHQPETRKAMEFAKKLWGRVKLCQYARGVSSKTIITSPEEDHMVKVNRTSWLDMSLSRFHTGSVIIPKDVGHEYRDHIKTLTRIYKKDSDGNLIGTYVKSDAANDHFAHAHNYNEIALTLAASLTSSENITGVL